jgi:hypothetical protein
MVTDAGAQTTPVRTELWPEILFRYQVDKDTTVTLGSRLRYEMGRRRLHRAEQALLLSHSLAPWFAAGLGFQHGNSTNPAVSRFEEERLMVNQVFRAPLVAGFSIDFRILEEFRWLPQGFSVRLRERAQIHRRTTIDDYAFTPFASAELFWDSRFNDFVSYRLISGMTLPIYRALSAQPYFQHHVDFGTRNSAVQNVIGLTLITSF